MCYITIEDTSTWTLHCLNRAHGPTKKHFCSCPAHEDIGLKWSHLGLGKSSLLLNQTSLTSWAAQTWLRGYYFFTVCWVQDSQTPGLPDAWILELESWLWLAAAWERGGGSCWMLMVSGWHCWTTEVRRPKEVRQCCENPSSASPVWGMQHKSEKFSEQQTRTTNNPPPQASVKAA